MGPRVLYDGHITVNNGVAARQSKRSRFAHAKSHRMHIDACIRAGQSGWRFALLSVSESGASSVPRICYDKGCNHSSDSISVPHRPDLLISRLTPSACSYRPWDHRRVIRNKRVQRCPGFPLSTFSAYQNSGCATLALISRLSRQKPGQGTGNRRGG